MITNTDRSGWFGASDTSMLFANTNTDSFRLWWLVKLGIIKNDFINIYTNTGNLLEIPIIEKIREITGEKIKLGKHPYYIKDKRIRVNIDGYTKTKNIEIKTSKTGFSKPSLAYFRQCQVIMYVTKKLYCDLWVYTLLPDDYLTPYFPSIDAERLSKISIQYDECFINNEYIPRVNYFSECLRKKVFPDGSKIQ